MEKTRKTWIVVVMLSVLLQFGWGHEDGGGIDILFEEDNAIARNLRRETEQNVLLMDLGSMDYSGSFDFSFDDFDTDVPTVLPTEIPSVVPSVYPTVVPTTSPTSLPTVSPTTSPTSLPTVSPTRAPSRVPTIVPTAIPSEIPSHAPTSIYDTLEATAHTQECLTACGYDSWGPEEYCAFYSSSKCNFDKISHFSCVPSCLSCADVFCDVFSSLYYSCPLGNHPMGSYAMKSSLESYCLGNYSSTSKTKTQMSFTTDVTFQGVTKESFQDPNSRSAAIAAMSLAVSGVPENNINITSVVDARRRELLSVWATSGGVKVTFAIIAIVEELGYQSNDFMSAFDSLKTQIEESVTSGQFTHNLKASAAKLNISTFDSAAADSVSGFSDPVVDVLVSAPPTVSPTLGPGNEAASEDSAGLSGGAVAGIVIGVVIGVLLISGAVYFFCIKRRDAGKMESQFRSAVVPGQPHYNTVPAPMHGSHSVELS